MVSILNIIRLQYSPKDFVVGVDEAGQPTYTPATPGTQSAPGLIIFRYDAELFYANANRFVDDVETLIESAPDPGRVAHPRCRRRSTTSTTRRHSR